MIGAHVAGCRCERCLRVAKILESYARIERAVDRFARAVIRARRHPSYRNGAAIRIQRDRRR